MPTVLEAEFTETVVRCLPRLAAALSKLPELPAEQKELAKRIAAGRYNAIFNGPKALALYSWRRPSCSS